MRGAVLALTLLILASTSGLAAGSALDTPDPMATTGLVPVAELPEDPWLVVTADAAGGVTAEIVDGPPAWTHHDGDSTTFGCSGLAPVGTTCSQKWIDPAHKIVQGFALPLCVDTFFVGACYVGTLDSKLIGSEDTRTLVCDTTRASVFLGGWIGTPTSLIDCWVSGSMPLFETFHHFCWSRPSGAYELDLADAEGGIGRWACWYDHDPV